MPTETKGFAYTEALRILCRDICGKVREFKHIDPDRIGYSFNRARNSTTRYGGWASMTPLLFEDGALATVRETRVCSTSVLGRPTQVVVRQYFKARRVLGNDGRTELLYIFNVMAPRFMNLSLSEKIDTVMHELYHIHPSFNGDIRRFPGRNWQHGSKKLYDAKAASLSREWLASDPDPSAFEFLRYNMDELCERYGQISGWRFPKIPLIKIDEAEAFRLNPKLRTRI